MAKLNITLFGVLSEIAGSSKITIENISNTDELKSSLTNKYPEFNKHNLLLAVNNKQIKTSTALNEGDNVSVMPPFSGG